MDDVIVTKPKDIIRYNKAQLKRANLNLDNAEKRGDTRAVKNILRKIGIYELTIELVSKYADANCN